MAASLVALAHRPRSTRLLCQPNRTVRLIQSLTTLGVVACVSSCAATSTSHSTPLALPAASPSTSRSAWDFDFKEARIKGEVFYEDIELGELEYDPEGAFDFDVPDIDRTRSGVRGMYGWPEMQVYVQLFVEEFASNPEFDLFGFGAGVTGDPDVHEFSDGVSVVIPYRLGFNVTAGEEDVGATEQTLAYAEMESEVGVGIDFAGLRPSVGFYVSSISGTIEIDDNITDPETDFDGANAGGYAQISYKHKDVPVYGRFRALAGDVEGFVFTVGAAF